MNEGALFDALVEELSAQGIEPAEAEAEARLVFREGLGLDLGQVMMSRGALFPEALAQGSKTLEHSRHSYILDYIERRSRHEPPQYIIGRAPFWDFSVAVAPGVLIPRPETEHLVDAVLRYGPSGPGRILEIGVGSGAPLIAILKERPQWSAVATDISTAALAVARANLREHGLEGRVELRLDDLYSGGERFALVFANPPYVAETDRETLAPELAYEPETALFSGPDGLTLIRRLLSAAPAWLSPGALLLLEIGSGQEGTVLELINPTSWIRRETICDYAGLPRIVVLECGR